MEGGASGLQWGEEEGGGERGADLALGGKVLWVLSSDILWPSTGTEGPKGCQVRLGGEERSPRLRFSLPVARGDGAAFVYAPGPGGQRMQRIRAAKRRDLEENRELDRVVQQVEAESKSTKGNSGVYGYRDGDWAGMDSVDNENQSPVSQVTFWSTSEPKAGRGRGLPFLEMGIRDGDGIGLDARRRGGHGQKGNGRTGLAGNDARNSRQGWEAGGS
ncbi:hypothetical protein QBC44DRAFT_303494 [Cladorrhinum sp. PSN332]|nr:hypothetical protein QBC44DRAFT_303494 [Cladorrhinum sp. PSN332]